jgi:hypothetical protein
MKTITDTPLRKRIASRFAGCVPLPVLALLISLFLQPLIGYAAPDAPSVNELKRQAQQAFINNRYAAAAALNLQIAEKHPQSDARRYAVLMLGNLYENNLVDLQKAIKWYGVYREEYADPRQAAFYREKIALLASLLPQEQAFADYQAVRFSNAGDEAVVARFEALLAKHPDFLLKDDVQRALGYAYDRLDRRRQCYLAFQDLVQRGGKGATESDRWAYEKARRHWRMTSVWAGVAWGAVAVLWAAALLMKPWERLTRASFKSFFIGSCLWLLLAGSRMPSFHAIDSSADQFHFPGSAVYLAAVINLPVLFWLLLMTRGKFWETRPRALRWASPLLTVLMTTAVLYLFFVYQPNGPKIMDAFVVKYRGWFETEQTPQAVHAHTAGELVN